MCVFLTGPACCCPNLRSCVKVNSPYLSHIQSYKLNLKSEMSSLYSAQVLLCFSEMQFQLCPCLPKEQNKGVIFFFSSLFFISLFGSTSKNNRGGFSHFAALGKHGHSALYSPNNWNCISEKQNAKCPVVLTHGSKQAYEKKGRKKKITPLFCFCCQQTDVGI